jgi:feruloyl-CoA synthase
VEEAFQLAYASSACIEVKRDSGALVLRNTAQFELFADTTYEALTRWAETTPGATFLAEHDGTSWRRVSYSQALARVDSLARRLLALGCSAEFPLAIVSENSINHALITLAAMSVGVPVAPLSTAYASLAEDFSRLRYMLELVGPKAVYFGEPDRCTRAMAAIGDLAHLLQFGGGSKPGILDLEHVIEAKEITRRTANASVNQDTIAKLMFTSGSTGKPKAVINTQRMLCSNQAMLRKIWPNLAKAAPVLVDWLPWSHTFGANFTFNLALFNGGALYIDNGRPMPQAIETTVANLAEIRPTVYFNVPSGFEALLERLRKDEEVAKKIFSRMDFAFFAAASLPQSVRDELQQLALRTTGRVLPFFTGWGSTETAPAATATWWSTERSDNIGLPLPGVELKFAPDGDKLELRVRGPNVTPGYWKTSEDHAKAFDADGYYRMGDAGLLVDDYDPTAGVRFDGRISENFKLRSGTWVSVGTIRLAILEEARPLVRDVVVAGSGRSEVGLLVFINHQVCRELLGPKCGGILDAEVSRQPEVRLAIRNAIEQYNQVGRGSSSKVARFLVLTDQPRIEAFEITDKGYINQRATLLARIDDVERLYDADDYLL